MFDDSVSHCARIQNTINIEWMQIASTLTTQTSVRFLIILQLIPNTAWKDYSSNTNYAFDAYDHDEKHNGKSRNGANSRSSTATMHNGISQQTTLQMSHSPNKSQYYDISRNGNRYGDQARWVLTDPEN